MALWKRKRSAPPNSGNGIQHARRNHCAREPCIDLTEHGISTRILEALLAGMLVCGIVVSGVVVVRNTLPKEPCSIGAQISLLAGSTLVGRGVLPVGSEW